MVGKDVATDRTDRAAHKFGKTVDAKLEEAFHDGLIGDSDQGSVILRIDNTRYFEINTQAPHVKESMLLRKKPQSFELLSEDIFREVSL